MLGFKAFGIGATALVFAMAVSGIDQLKADRTIEPRATRSFVPLSANNIGPSSPPPIYWCNYQSPKSCFEHASDCANANSGKPCSLHLIDPYIRPGPPPTGTQREVAAVLAATKLEPDYIPKQRHWVSPAERCKSQDGKKEGYVSDGDGGRRCEYFGMKPRADSATAQQ